jgi:dTDP-4-dehydrorhamnose reductase
VADSDILVTGGSGQVGTELGRLALPGLRFVAPPRAELDLTKPASLAAAVADRPWAAIINAAAYTAVDAAESDPLTAWTVNALAPAALAEAADRTGIPLIHVSTDYVFDGRKVGAYVEDDPIGPLGVYGASKLGGELAVRTSAKRHIILRTAWVVSAHGKNFLKTMLRLAETRPELGVVDDQHGCPTAAADIARTLGIIAGRLIADQASPSGTYHFVNSGEASWCDLALEIFVISRAAGGPSAAVRPINTADYPTPARRPANSRLDTNKLSTDFGITPRSWQEPVSEIIAELLGTSSSNGN